MRRATDDEGRPLFSWLCRLFGHRTITAHGTWCVRRRCSYVDEGTR